MSLISEWSVVAAQNGTRGSPPNYWPEGQAPSTVNDCARLMMSTLRIQMQDAQWFNWGYTCTRIAGNKFSMDIGTASATTSVVANFVVGRRIKLYDTNTLYATITESSLSASDINLTVAVDSGSLTNSFSSAYLSIISPNNSALPTAVSSGSPLDNLVINSDFQVNQLGSTFTSATTPANNDDTYLLDQWILLSDGNDIVDVSQDTTNIPTGSYASIKLDVETANKKFGILQLFENKISAAAIGKQVSVSFSAKKEGANATFETLRMAVISWDGTADTVTSDVVSAWGAAGTNPTLVANWTYENTATNLTLTSSFQTFSISAISIDTASTKNIGLFIWCDDTDATVGDIAYISQIKLEVSSSISAWVQTPITLEIASSQRYMSTSYNMGTAPGTATSGGRKYFAWNASGTAQKAIGVEFAVAMRVAPTVTSYAITNGAAGYIDIDSTTPVLSFIDNPGTNGVGIGTNDTTSAVNIGYEFLAVATL